MLTAGSILVAVVFVLAVVVVAAAWLIGSRPVVPERVPVGDPPVDLNAERIELPSASGSVLVGWHAAAAGGRGVIVLAHPYRGSRLSMINRARLLYDAGYSIVMVDLQAHGESPGKRITIGHLERHDVRAAVDYARRAHPGEPLGVIGFSMGGAAALLAGLTGIQALILEAVYPTVRAAVCNRARVRLGKLSRLAAELMLLQFRPRLGVSPSQLRPIDCLATIGCPVLIMSGTADAHTTAEDTRAMYAAAQEPRELWMVEGADHEDLHDFAPDEYRPRVLRFFEQHLRRNRVEQNAASETAEVQACESGRHTPDSF